MQKYDICFFYEEYSFSGGVKTYIDQISDFLEKNGLKTKILSCIQSNQGVVSLSFKKNIYIYLTPLYLAKLTIFFFKNRFKIVHCQSLYSLILVNIAKTLLHQKFTIISTIHIPYWESFLTRGFKKIGIPIKANVLIWCCEYSLQETSKKQLIQANESFSILNWSFLQEQENKLQEKDNSIVFVGHLSYQKNIDLLAQIIESLPAFSFKIIGEGEDRKKLENLDNAKLMWLIPHEQVIQEVKQSKLLVLTSKFEALPYVVLEALSLNIPVVSSDVGGIWELCTYTNQLFLCKNKQDFIDNIQHIYQQWVQNAFNNIADISAEKQLQKYWKVYKKYL